MKKMKKEKKQNNIFNSDKLSVPFRTFRKNISNLLDKLNESELKDIVNYQKKKKKMIK